MELIEIRDLDGPNLFALEPVIKIEIRFPAADETTNRQVESARQGGDAAATLDRLAEIVRTIHRYSGERVPAIKITPMDQAGHFALCFPWTWRTFSLRLAEIAFDALNGMPFEARLPDLDAARTCDREANDRPTWVRDFERTARAIAVTGTNGKTTTTRLLSHIARSAGHSTGWSSSSGVYINDEQVLEGDYTGHGGARRVLADPTVEIAILETARGGILLRGIGYESNDVGVFLNVSADHIGLHGVTKLETLARVKSTVVRVTKPTGVAVLNAEDERVMDQEHDLRAERMLFSQNPTLPRIQEHAASGGRYVVRNGSDIVYGEGSEQSVITSLDKVPITFEGDARHMVENALAACAASIAIGLTVPVIQAGLATFTPDPQHNAGRLNVFELDGRHIVVDYAHNEGGLKALFEFARARFPDRSSLSAVIGTAGDREDDVFRRLGALAAEESDRILLKNNPGYMRGREPEETIQLMREGVEQSGGTAKIVGVFPSEFDATFGELTTARPGDVLVIMCVEDFRSVIERLQELTSCNASILEK